MQGFSVAPPSVFSIKILSQFIGVYQILIVQRLTLMFYVWLILGLNLNPKDKLSWMWYFTVPPGECRARALRQGTYHDRVHNTARRNIHMGSRGTIYQQLNINSERRQFPHPQILTPDDDQFGRNMSWRLLKWLAFIKFYKLLHIKL
jgi:hypothetical protein